MRQNITSTIFILTLCMFLFTPVVVCAQEESYNIIISNTTYDYIKTEGSGTQIFEFFNINITLRNLGVNGSDEITVELIDQDNMSVRRKYTFDPLEKKSFLFSNHPISGTGDHEITINFYPTDETKKNNYNSGSEIFVINKGNLTGGSTPGFEITLILLVLTLFIFLKEKNML